MAADPYRLFKNVSFWIVVLGAYIAFMHWTHDPQEPTQEVRASAYAEFYEIKLRECHHTYPYREQILAETGQTYEECATSRTLVAMEYWELYYPDVEIPSTKGNVNSE